MDKIIDEILKVFKTLFSNFKKDFFTNNFSFGGIDFKDYFDRVSNELALLISLHQNSLLSLLKGVKNGSLKFWELKFENMESYILVFNFLLLFIALVVGFTREDQKRSLVCSISYDTLLSYIFVVLPYRNCFLFTNVKTLIWKLNDKNTSGFKNFLKHYDAHLFLISFVLSFVLMFIFSFFKYMPVLFAFLYMYARLAPETGNKFLVVLGALILYYILYVFVIRYVLMFANSLLYSVVSSLVLTNFSVLFISKNEQLLKDARYYFGQIFKFHNVYSNKILLVCYALIAITFIKQLGYIPKIRGALFSYYRNKN